MSSDSGDSAGELTHPTSTDDLPTSTGSGPAHVSMTEHLQQDFEWHTVFAIDGLAAPEGQGNHA